MPSIEFKDLFPTPVMQVRGCVGSPLLEQLQDAARSQADQRNRRSALLHHSEIADGSNPIGTALAGRVLPQVGRLGERLFGQALEWSIKEFWFNRLQTGGSQSLHSHSNSFISGILYLSESHASARTLFHRGLGGRDYQFTHAGPDVAMGPYNADQWVAPAMAPGDALLYPSYLLHEVPVNEGDERMTLAFNAVPGYLDSHGYRITFQSSRL